MLKLKGNIFINFVQQEVDNNIVKFEEMSFNHILDVIYLLNCGMCLTFLIFIKEYILFAIKSYFTKPSQKRCKTKRRININRRIRVQSITYLQYYGNCVVITSTDNIKNLS